ncbi:hypothetical protein J1605_022798 [Eschrichtius robustus]|uniref:C-X-C motif chemokine n=1 Tax=Eschrichtius robustus TaxID=9764 RepID=A0AB34H8L0_ESCRO|nr:hypothetical protein J1605_022798 [Eschrichtius robustus]
MARAATPATARLLRAALLFLLLVAAGRRAAGAPVVTELRCRCLQTLQGIHFKNIQSVQVTPPGPQCGQTEVVATLKTGQEVCLNPEAPMVKKIINKMLNNHAFAHLALSWNVFHPSVFPLYLENSLSLRLTTKLHSHLINAEKILIENAETNGERKTLNGFARLGEPQSPLRQPSSAPSRRTQRPSELNPMARAATPATARLLRAALLFLLLVAAGRRAAGAPVVTELRCRCLQTLQGIHFKNIQSVQVTPPGPQCGQTEVVATLKTGQEVCLNPEAPMVKKIINKMLNKSLICSGVRRIFQVPSILIRLS